MKLISEAKKEVTKNFIDAKKKLINDLPVKQITNMIHMKYNLPKRMVYDLCLKSKKTK